MTAYYNEAQSEEMRRLMACEPRTKTLYEQIIRCFTNLRLQFARPVLLKLTYAQMLQLADEVPGYKHWHRELNALMVDGVRIQIREFTL